MKDVIIIGAGPSGSSLAILMAEQGFKVLIVDRDYFPRPKICGECLSPQALPLLHRLGITTANLLDIGAYPYQGFKLTGPSGRAISLSYPASSAEPLTGYCVPRAKFDFLLLEKARSFPNVEVMEGFQMQKVIRTADGVCEMSGIKDHKHPHEFQSRLVVSATGRENPIPHHGLQRLCLLASYDLVADIKPLMECGVVSGKLQYLLGPRGPASALVCLVLNLSHQEISQIHKDDLFERSLAEITGLRERFRQAIRRSPVRGTVIHRYAPKHLVEDGRMKIGDQTGFIDPITGEGMYRALRSASLACDTLSAALKSGDISRQGLISYEQNMKKEFFWLYQFVRICAWFTTKPVAVQWLIDRLEKKPQAAGLLAALQGAMAPARIFFSWKFWAFLLGLKKEFSYDYLYHEPGNGSASSPLFTTRNIPPV